MNNDIKSIDEQIALLAIQKNLALESQLQSNNPQDIYKAVNYIQQQKLKDKRDVKAFLFDPYDTYHQYGGYKQQRKRVAFEILKKVSDTPIVGSILNTRIFQIQNFLVFTEDESKEGFTIRRKKSLFEDKKQTKSLSDEDKRNIEFMVNFLENGGLKEKWDQIDSFSDFVRKFMRDSLTYDQTAAECQRNRKFDLISFQAVDASTIRILETIDPRFKEKAKEDFEEVFGYLPRYAQVFQGNIMINPFSKERVVYYPWELMFEQRNKTTDINKNGYGTSEIEVLLDIITWALWGMQYNGNFFKQGSNPKGFINLKSDGVNMDIVNDFRQTWRQMIAGVNNSHKIPVFSGIDLEWVDLQSTNKDMEFQQWMEFLIIMMCSVFTIDPSELGYQFQRQAQIFGQSGQKERLEHSKHKGLKPLLIFLQKAVTKYIISEIDKDYEFVFTGIDIEDEQVSVELDNKKVSGGLISFESAFEKYMGRPYDKKKDTILNPTFLQIKQMEQFGGVESNGAVDEMTGGEGGAPNPFADFNEQQLNKSMESDPILREARNYIDMNINT